MVSQLRCGQPVTDGEALYRQACRWVTEAREALTAGGVSEASAEQMLYAYCALLDESVLNRASQDDGYRRWRKDPLQARFFSTLNAGEELWERIRQLLREAHGGCGSADLFLSYFATGVCRTVPRRG